MFENPEDDHRRVWLNNLENHTRFIREQHMERVRKRKLVENGTMQDNYCDVCGLETRVYAFECAGDEATHMYCYYCAFAVTAALETFMREHRIGR